MEKGKSWLRDDSSYDDPLDAAFDRHWIDLCCEFQSVKPALDHLNGAETLFREFPTPEMQIRYLQTRSGLLLVPDPLQALADLIEAIRIVQSLPAGDERLGELMMEALFANTRMRVKPLAPEAKIRAVVESYREVVAPYLIESWSRHFDREPE